MKQHLRSLAPLLLALVAAPAAAQETRSLQLGAGLQYPLVSQEFNVGQALGYHVRAGFTLRDNLWANFTYELTPTRASFGNYSDVDVSTYGLGLDYAFAGEEGVRIFLTTAIGLGQLEVADEGSFAEGTIKSTDLDLWYEIGGGLLLGQSERWLLRFGLTYRRLSPDEKTGLMTGTRGELHPSLAALWRF